MQNVIDFADKVISQKNKSITDEILLLIQNDKNLMQEYLRLVEREKGGHKTVNRIIGKRVKDRYGLTNADYRNNKPLSTLIKSNQEFV